MVDSEVGLMRAQAGPLSRPTLSLVTASAEWIDAALSAYATDRLMQVSALAPLAVEQLAKAVLWHQNPVLLSPLDRVHEASFVSLATNPDLRDPRLRTIGLREVLDRAGKVMGSECPIPKARLTRLVECRNGAVHVGSADGDLVRHVLSDCLAVIRWLLPAVGYSEAPFYGTNFPDVVDLLDQQKTEIERHVADALATARRKFAALRKSLGNTKLFEESVKQLEQSVGLRPHLPEYAVSQACPACSSKGRLSGTVSLVRRAGMDESDVAWASDWEVQFSPEQFLCFVCNLAVSSVQELAAARLPATPRVLSADSVDFEIESLLALDDDRA